MLKITKILPMTIESEDSLDELAMIIEPKDSLDELASYLTEHIDEYYKFKENYKKVSFWFGRRGHIFHIKAEADQIKPWFLNTDLFLADRKFSQWEVYIEELVHDVHLAPFIGTHGVLPTWSSVFPMKQIKKIAYEMSLEIEDFYA